LAAAIDCPTSPIRRQEVPAAAIKAAAHILFRHIVTTDRHPQSHASDRLRGGTDNNVVQQESVTSIFSLADQRDIGLAIERRFDGKTGPCGNQRPGLFQQQAACSKCAQRRVER